MRMTFFILFVLSSIFVACDNESVTTEDNIAAVEVPEKFVYQDLSVAEFKAKMGEENVAIIDVRTPAEIAEGKIPEAIEIDIRRADFGDRIKGLDPDKTYLVYCKGGGRSAAACGALNDLGYDNIYNLKGGFTAFSAAD